MKGDLTFGTPGKFMTKICIRSATSRLVNPAKDNVTKLGGEEKEMTIEGNLPDQVLSRYVQVGCIAHRPVEKLGCVVADVFGVGLRGLVERKERG